MVKFNSSQMRNIKNEFWHVTFQEAPKRRQDFPSDGGDHFRGSASYGVRGWSPMTPPNFENLQKISYQNGKKDYFGLFSKKQKLCVKFSHFLTKNTIVLEFFEKIFQNFFRK